MSELKKDLLNYFQEEATHPLSIEEVQEIFSAESSEELMELMKRLNELEEEGELVRTRKNRYGLAERMNLVRGTIQMHAKGFAFLIPDDEDKDDVYINSHDLMSAMNGDLVLVRVNVDSIEGNRPEGVVLRILERNNDKVIGTYQDNGRFGFVIADDKRIPNDIFIQEGNNNGAADGHKVIVKITEFPKDKKSAEGEVVEDSPVM